MESTFIRLWYGNFKIERRIELQKFPIICYITHSEQILRFQYGAESKTSDKISPIKQL